MIPVIWKNAVNATATDNTLQKTSGTDATWNAGAVSLQYLEAGDGYIEAIIDQSNINVMFGFSKGDIDQNFPDIDFAYYVHSTAKAVYHKSGSNSGETSAGFISIGDVLRIEISGNDILLKKNGVTWHTDPNAISSSNYPLLVDTSIHTINTRLNNVMLEGFEGIKAVEWISAINVGVTGNDLQKTSGTNNVWNAGAVSSQWLLSGDGYVEMTVSETNTHRMFGLSKGNIDQQHTDIDFAIQLRDNATLEVRLNGTTVFTGTTYTTNDTLRIEASLNDVVFKKNGITFHTEIAALTSNSYPFLVDTSIYHIAGTLNDVFVVGFEELPELDFPKTPVKWIDTVNVSFIDNNLTKTSGGTAWNAGAVSQQMLYEGNGYVETTIIQNNTSRMIGLTKGNPDQTYTGIDYTLYLVSLTEARVYLNGVNSFTLPSYSPGDVFRIEILDSNVLFKQNGIVFYSINNTIGTNSYPLLVDTSMYTENSSLNDVVVSGFKEAKEPPTTGNPVQWINHVNVTSNGNTLQKTSGTNNTWDGGAVSSQRLLEGNGYVEATLIATNTTSMLALSKGSENESFAELNHAISPSNAGKLRVYENGTAVVGDAGGPSYNIGDVIKIEISGSDVIYKQNGNAFFTQVGVIDQSSYPLLVDTSLATSNVILQDVIVSDSFQEIKPLRLPARLVRWSSVANICIEGQRLEKIAGADAWDAGTESKQSISSGNCYVETKLAKNNLSRMFGLNKGSSNYTNDIDFAASLHSDGTFRVYENGIEVGTHGQYNSGDIVRVEINDDSVFYRVNGEIRFARFGVINASNYPFIAVVAMKGIVSVFENVRIGSDAFPQRQSIVY